ncbi:hypothetical protein D6764_03605 [Candidatus Woesearchaeota archaeon]|nr:MAG: hypothetical protein D6764_03605 [Candidatus Woesearchaeota archaeon]
MSFFRSKKRWLPKRASSQVDWAISLGIFLLYIAWFFILARPIYETDNSLETIAEFIADEIVENSSWTVSKIPLFFNSTYSDAFEPVIAGFPFDWDNSSFTISPERYFAVDSVMNRLYSVYSTSGGNFTVWLVHSEADYEVPFFSKDLEATENYARITGKDFEVSFLNSSVSQAEYRNVLRIINYSLFINGAEFIANWSDFFGRPVIARYLSGTGDANQTFMIFPERSRIFFDVSASGFVDNTITLSFALDDYPSYYANPDAMGDFNYSLNGCVNSSGDYLKIYSSLSGIVFRTDKEAFYRMCAINQSVLYLNLTAEGDGLEGVIIFHDASENLSTYWRPVNYGVGVAVKRKGLSLSKIEELSEKNYELVKDYWNIPENVDFSFSLYNSSNEEVVSFEPERPLETDNVFAVKRSTGIVDKSGVWKPYTLVVRAW